MSRPSHAAVGPPVTAAIEAAGLEKVYPNGERAVAGVSFQVDPGEIFGFLGPNGAGKTTTISMLCTLLRPTSGTARVAGHDVVTDRSEVRRAIGLVFQDRTLDEHLSAEQNLRFHAYAYGVPRAVYKQRIPQLLQMVGLWERRRDRVTTYSGGMKRRLEIARGLLHHPRVLFLDEPTLGLDPQTRRYIWDHIAELRHREGITVFLTTHYMDEAEACGRIAIIDYGQILALDTPERLKDALGGDVVLLRTADTPAAVRTLQHRYALAPEVHGEVVSFTVRRGEEFLPRFIKTFPAPLLSIGLHRPTLDDVFLRFTGRSIREQPSGTRDELRQMAAGAVRR